MPRVLLLTIEPKTNQGGIARYIEAIAQTFPNEVIVEHLTSASYPAIFSAIWKRHLEINNVWVHNILPVGTVTWLTSFIGGHPYIIFLHGLDFDLARRNVWKRWLTRRILERATGIVTNSKALAAEVRQFVPLASEPMVVYPVVSDEMLNASAATSPLTPSMNGGEVMTLLTVARLVERKGHLKVLQALAELPGVNYVIVGEGPMRSQIEAEIQRRELEDRVILSGNLEDTELAEVYRQADIFVMPTSKTEHDREGFGIAYLEAQLFGLPVVATRHPGVDEAIKDNETGMLVDDIPHALFEALRKLVSDPELRKKLGSQGPAFVRANFTRRAQMEKLRSCL